MASETIVRKSALKRTMMSSFGGSERDVNFDVDHVGHYQVYRGMSPNTSNRLEMRIKELEEGLEEERNGRLRAERELNEVGFQVENLSERLEEADGLTAAQNEVGRRREQELLKMKKDLEILLAEREQSEASFRKKHQDAVNEMNQQVDNANRFRSKVEKERQMMIVELESLSSQLELTSKAKVFAESKLAEMDEQLRRMRLQLDDQGHQLQDVNALRARVAQENFELHRHLQDLDAGNVQLAKSKSALQSELEETKSRLEDETRVRNQLAIQVTNLQLELDGAVTRLDEEAAAAENARSQLQRANYELQQLKAKYEKEIVTVTEQVEETRRKMAVRLSEVESAAEQANSRSVKLEKEKNKLQLEMRDILADFDDAQAQVGELSKRLKAADQAAAELQGRADELTAEIHGATGEIQRLHADIGRLRVANDDQQTKIDALNRDNKQLAESLREAQVFSKEQRAQLQDMQAVRVQLEVERNSAIAELDDLREALREAETRLDSANAALGLLRNETERRLKEKDDVADAIRKSGQRAMDELQRTVIDVESKFKSELSRVRKRQEVQLAEYETQLDTLSRSNGELARANKALAARIKEIELSLDDERRSCDDARQAAAILDRKRIALHTELEDVRSLLDTSERARKNAENELAETSQRVGELTVSLNAAVAERRRFDADVAGLRAELDEAMRDRGEANDRAARVQADLGRAVDELRQAEEAQRMAEVTRQRLEAELRDMAARLEQAETVAFREGKRLVAKLQTRMQEIEAEFENEARRGRDLTTENRKLQRLLAETRSQSEEDKRLTNETTERCQVLQNRVKQLKKQLEEAEEIVIITMNKYRKAHQLLQEAELSHSDTMALDTVGALGGRPGNVSTQRKGNRSMSVTREVTRVVRV